MTDPMLWFGFSGMFALAGLINLARAAKTGPRRPVRIALAGSCFLWSLAAYIFRFASMMAGWVVVAAAAVLMLYAALLSASLQKQDR